MDFGGQIPKGGKNIPEQPKNPNFSNCPFPDSRVQDRTDSPP